MFTVRVGLTSTIVIAITVSLFLRVTFALLLSKFRHAPSDEVTVSRPTGEGGTASRFDVGSPSTSRNVKDRTNPQSDFPLEAF